MKTRISAVIFTMFFAFQAGLHAQDFLSDTYLLADDEEVTMRTSLQWTQAQTFVTTASKFKETVQEAPANITVITAEQIESLGVNTLAEVLSYVPGVTVMETYFGHTAVTFRGNFQEIYNNKSLLLINGHPSWDVMNGNYKLEMVPIDAIKQIEIIRGPGSVLYGTNAFAGVINVITYKGNEMDGALVSGKGGAFGSYEARASAGRGEEDGFNFFVSASHYNTDGYDYEVTRDELGLSDRAVLGDVLEYENQVTNLFLSLSNAGFTLNAGYFEQEKMKFGFVPILYTSGLNEFEGYFLDAQYRYAFTDTMSLQANARYDTMYKKYNLPSATGGEDYFDLEGFKWGTEVQLDIAPSDLLRFTLGGSFDRYENDMPWDVKTVSTRIGTLFATYPEVDYTDEVALYAQASWKPVEDLNVVAGLRFNDNDRAGSDTTPSLGAVYRIGDEKYVKILYGEAFRSPNLFEQTIFMPSVAYGDQDLEPETIQTLDIGVDLLLTEAYNLKLNLFHLETENTIERGDPADAVGTLPFVNGAGQEVQGLEVDFTANLSEAVSAFVNASYQTGELEDSGLDIPFLAEQTANAGVNWNIIEPVSLNANVQYIGEREDNNSNVSVDAYTLVNLQLVVRPMENLKILLSANNVFDEEYEYPEYIRQNIPTVPGGPEAAYYAKVEWKI
jgi:iron complex outermembrane receptor protein